MERSVAVKMKLLEYTRRERVRDVCATMTVSRTGASVSKLGAATTVANTNKQTALPPSHEARGPIIFPQPQLNPRGK